MVGLDVSTRFFHGLKTLRAAPLGLRASFGPVQALPRPFSAHGSARAHSEADLE